MSASSRPTRRPSMWKARARLVATVDLRTPPLPLATATTCLTPGKLIWGGGPPGCIAILLRSVGTDRGELARSAVRALPQLTLVTLTLRMQGAEREDLGVGTVV